MTSSHAPDTAHKITQEQDAIALLDETHLNAITGGDASLAKDVLNIFADNAQTYVKNLREARSSEDWHNAAHTLKGSARGIGAWRLAELCEHAEKLSASGGPADRSIAVGDISCAVSKVVATIAARQTQVDLAS